MVSEFVQLGTELVRLANKLLDGTATPEEVKHVRDILHARSASAQAEEEILAAKRLENIAELDDVGGDEDEQTWPGQR